MTQAKAALCRELAGCSQAFWRGHGGDLEAASSFASREGSEQAPAHPPSFLKGGGEFIAIIRVAFGKFNVTRRVL